MARKTGSIFSRIVLAAFAVFSLLVLAPSPARAAAEFRGVWVDAWGAGFLTPAEVTTLVNRCTTYNFNAVVVQMRRRGDAFYMPMAPNGDPRTTAISSTYDALQEVINQCHAAVPRIEVHCWATTQLIWGNSPAPSQAGHVYNLHPEYLTKSSTGATLIGEGYYLDPGHPDATQWNYNVALDVVSRYDIDGWHWDYIRLPAQDSGYNDTAVARYNAEFGLSGQPAASNTQWSDWRRRHITDFLRWTDSEILAIKPNMVISTAVFASRSDAFTNRLQDWAAWNTEGIIDICMPMNYSADNAGVFNPRVDDAFNNQGIRRAYIGQGAYLNTAANTVTQLTYVRNKPLLGTVFYSYRTPNSGTVDQTGTFTYVRDNYQPTYEPTPSIPWKSSPTKGIGKGTITRADTGAVIYNATVSINTAPARTQKSEAHGKYAFFELAPGTYSVSATAAGLGSISGNITITAGAVSNLNLAVPAADTVAPTISSVASSGITDSAATITWTTNESSDSVVEYGLTTSYGSTVSNASMVLNHSIGLSGLSASTTYNYRVKSKDASNNTGTSGNFTFTTLASGVVADIIIDTPAAVATGSWTLATSAVDKYGADYKYKGQGTGAAYLTYTPNILTAGDYDVYEWHSVGTNRTVGAPHVVTHSGGTATVNINQQVSGGAWNLVGRYAFPTGTTKYARITDGFADAGQVVIADAVKFVYVSAPAPTAPAAPSGLTATAASSSQINLAWTDNSANEDNFVVARSGTAGGPYTDIATLAAGTTSYSNTGLAASTTYFYVVRATNAVGASANSNEASATTQAAPALPNAPSGLTATAVAGRKINLAWTDNSTNEDNFVVERKVGTGAYSVVATLGANVTSYTSTGLTKGKTYTFRVKATNAAGSSAYSNEASAVAIQ
ncbi:MAG: family 10 glycosylhydrolase [Candidatus Sumerlaeaceae bacterium]